VEVAGKQNLLPELFVFSGRKACTRVVRVVVRREQTRRSRKWVESDCQHGHEIVVSGLVIGIADVVIEIQVVDFPRPIPSPKSIGVNRRRTVKGIQLVGN